MYVRGEAIIQPAKRSARDVRRPGREGTRDVEAGNLFAVLTKHVRNDGRVHGNSHRWLATRPQTGGATPPAPGGPPIRSRQRSTRRARGRGADSGRRAAART